MVRQVVINQKSSFHESVAHDLLYNDEFNLRIALLISSSRRYVVLSKDGAPLVNGSTEEYVSHGPENSSLVPVQKLVLDAEAFCAKVLMDLLDDLLYL